MTWGEPTFPSKKKRKHAGDGPKSCEPVQVHSYMVGIPRSTVVSANCLTGFRPQSECIVVSLKIKGPHVGMRPVCLKDIPHASGRCGEDSNLRTPIGKYLRIRPNHFPHSSIGWHGDLYLHPTVSVWAGWLHRPMSFDRMKSCLFLYIPNFPHYQTGVHVQYLLVPWMVVWFSKVFGGECHHRCFHD